jgi:preprotein translocase subunit SecA
MEDDLMRLFGGERMAAIMDTLNVEETMPIQNGMLAKQIENAQARLEARNFAIRKTVLEYDDVMNRQRELIYQQRNQVLDGEDIHETVQKMIDTFIEGEVKNHCSEEIPDEWNLEGLKEMFGGWLLKEGDLDVDLNTVDEDEIAEIVKERAKELYAAREEEFGSELVRELERVMLLKSVDTNWMDHIDAMEQLKQGIGLRSYGQHNPLIDYRNEGYDMFSAMTDSIREQTARRVLTVQIRKNEEVKREKVAEETSTGAPQTVKGKGAVSKNALCPCGSGKKYKRCCGKDD